MARVSIYVNTMGRTEEQFAFYGSVFGTEPFGLMRMSDIPPSGDQPPLPPDEQNAVMHVEVEILAGTVLMGTDVLASMGHELIVGNNVSINLEPDTLEEAERLFERLSDGATDVVPLTRMFWGDHWGVLLDRYGIRWMFNVASQGDA
jgi:PhnB protein